MTDKEKIFADEYLIDLDASAAALRAGYKPSTAKMASKWINPKHPTKPKLREEIDRRLALRSKRTGIKADRVLRELGVIAFADAAQVVNDDGTLNRYADPDDLKAISSIRIAPGKDGDSIEVRMHDKNRALELIAKHLGLLTDNLRIEDVRPVIVDDIDKADSDAG